MQNQVQQEQFADVSVASRVVSGKDRHASERATNAWESIPSVSSPVLSAEEPGPSAWQDASELSEVASFPETVVDRLLTQIQEGAVHFRRLRQDSVEVVVTPDQETQLALRFSTRDGRMEAALRLESGNSELLVRHWPELRRTLAEQGIHLLEPDPSTGMNSDWSQNSHHHGRPDSGSEDNEVATPAWSSTVRSHKNDLRRPMGHSAPTVSHRLLESYA